VRCPHCGNENPETHRFCGMCGASLLQGPGAAMAAPGNSIATPAGSVSAPRTAAPTAGVPRSAAPESSPAATATIPRPNPPAPAPAAAAEAPTRAAARQTEPIAPRPLQRATEQEPVISGPSFLGLNQPAAPPPRRGRLSIDPNSAPSSGNLDYLLEDDEPRSGGGGWKVVLILIALALAVSFGYLRWKNQGLPFLNPAAKPAAQAPASTQTAPDANSNASAPTNPANTAPVNPANTTAGSPAPNSAATAPASNPGGSAATGNSPANATAPQSSASTSAPAAVTGAPSGGSNQAAVAAPAGSSNSAPAVTPSTTAGPGVNPSAATPNATAPASTPAAAPPSAPTKSDNSSEAAADNDAKNVATPASETSKPPAAIKRVDTVAEAQKYLYGKGVPQDCDRGLRLLKPAANAGNPKAMIEMGALYSAGLCAPHDLPTSYRWFAMALRKDPDNQSVATDLQKLWGEMTQPERQLAIRLSQ
jgi:zinc-ribbon domain